jgi:FAD/FMN-containing dehydrogenase
MGVLMAVGTITGAAGALLLPILLTQYGAFAALGGVGVATILLTIVGIALIGSSADRAVSPFEATIARVIRLPLFAGVSADRLEAAMQQVVEVPVAAGAVVIHQGEPADRFYLIESGTFAVSRSEQPGAAPTIVRRLGPDEAFGEIGLLQRSPRTATVTAESDGVLLALDGDAFLELVGASGPLRGRLLGLYAGGGAPP